MSERAAPFYCPYCGDEDLRPFGEKHGEWRCGSCRRVFRLGYIGIARDWTEDVQPDQRAEERAAPVQTSSEDGQ